MSNCASTELSLSEEVWFYNVITLARNADDEESPVLKEARVACFFLLCAPKIPSLWADMTHPNR